MPSITIAGKPVPITVPADLDAQLIAATGCSVAETLAALGTFTLAGNLAAVLRPLLPPDTLPGIALADALHAALLDDRAELLAAVRAALTVPAVTASGKDS